MSGSLYRYVAPGANRNLTRQSACCWKFDKSCCVACDCVFNLLADNPLESLASSAVFDMGSAAAIVALAAAESCAADI